MIVRDVNEKKLTALRIDTRRPAKRAVAPQGAAHAFNECNMSNNLEVI